MKQEICAYFGYDCDVINNYLETKNEKELEFIRNCENQRFIHKMTDQDKALFDLGYKVLREKRNDLEIDYNSYSRNKIMIDGQERKLFRYLKDPKLSEEVGKYKLPNKDLYFVISTNPDDFVLCSTNNSSWISCTDLNNGDFKYTAMGNVFTGGRFIMYVTDLKEKEFLDAKSYDMFFRAFGFVGEDSKLYGNIWYPMRENMDIYIEDIHINSVKKNTTSKYNIDKIFNNHKSFTPLYVDYGQVYKDGDNLKFWVGKEYRHTYPDTYFENGNSLRTSSYYWYKETDIDKAIKRKCDKCGTNIGYIQTHGNFNYCEDCMKEVKDICCYCGKEKANCHFTEYNKWVCEDCMEEKGLRICSCCGGTVKRKNQTECKFCRSTSIDAFKNICYEYYDKKANNVRDYFRHYIVDEEGTTPPGLLEDEEFFEEHEIYLKEE